MISQSRRFISLEEKLKILDRLKSGDKLTSLCKKFNRNESTTFVQLGKMKVEQELELLVGALLSARRCTSRIVCPKKLQYFPSFKYIQI